MKAAASQRLPLPARAESCLAGCSAASSGQLVGCHRAVPVLGLQRASAHTACKPWVLAHSPGVHATTGRLISIRLRWNAPAECMFRAAPALPQRS